MSKRDYTRFSNEHNKRKVEESVVVEPIVEENKDEAINIEAFVKEEVETKVKHGIVVECNKLNVRRKPNADSEVVCVVDASADLEVDEKASTEDFYKVCTATGAEGFCMKKFIKILP